MIHKITYDVYGLHPQTGEPRPMPQNTDLVVYTDLEVDEIKAGIKAMWLKEREEKVEIKIRRSELRPMANLLLAGNIRPLSGFAWEELQSPKPLNGYELHLSDPEEFTEENHLLNPDEL